MTYVETTRYSHFKPINITAARLTCTSDLYGPANDPGPQMIPVPQMIPKLDRK